MSSRLDYQFFIGIDIAKDSFVTASYAENQTHIFDNNLAGFEVFVKTYQAQLNQALIVLEVTGRYEMKLVKYLIQQGYHVHRARPLQVKNFIRSWGQKGKTDQIDAKALALYGKERRERLSVFQIKDDVLEKLDLLIKRRADLIEMQTKEKNRLKAPDNEFIQDSIQLMLSHIQNAIADVEKQIEDIMKNNESLQKKVQTAQKIPGIGKTSANNLIVSIPELGTLDRRKVASLIGLAPHPRDSGNKTGYRRTAKGREAVKRVLFMTAMAASQSKSSLGIYYRHLIENGKKPIIAIVALMRKILVILNAKIRDLIKEETSSI